MSTMKSIMKIIGALILLFIGFILFNLFSSISQETIKIEDEQIKARLIKRNTIECVLTANKRKYSLGESPSLSVKIINQLDTAIILVGSLDGSESGLRPPICYFDIRHKLIGQIRNSSFYCATFNRLRKEDLKIIESGQTFDPYEHTNDHGYFHAQSLEGKNFNLPGIYKITFHYSTSKNNREQLYNEKTKNEIMELWNKVPKLELKSNTITIEYDL